MRRLCNSAKCNVFEDYSHKYDHDDTMALDTAEIARLKAVKLAGADPSAPRWLDNLSGPLLLQFIGTWDYRPRAIELQPD